VIALLGNLSRDFLPGEPPRAGGAPFHAARALQRLHVHARIFARCAPGDRDELLRPVVALGTPVQYVPGTATASFEIAYDGERRRMRIVALGDTWLPSDLPALPGSARWIHVAPLARSDFPAETLAAVARGRRLSLDGQGLVRPARTGELELDADYDPELLRHVWVLKLSDEEAAPLGDPAGLPVREVLVTHGSSGATVYARDRVEHVPAFAIGANPTGAGDGFCISYIAARAAGFAPAAAARRATAVVASMLAEET
jgi:sugar/nucleoside kinase (ribokinase family)